MQVTRRAWAGIGAAAVIAAAGLLAVVLDAGDDADEVQTEESTTTTRSSTTSRETTSSSSSSTSSSSTTTRPSTTTTARPTTTVPPTAPPTTTHPLRSARVRLTRVATVDYPIAMAVFPGDGGLWIARKGGAVCRLGGGSCTSSQTVASVSNGGEQGLLGIAFNPSGSRFYASYTNPVGDTRLDEFTVGANGAPVVGSRRQIFAEVQPEPNHNGGNIVFGPDGRLYLGLGDGGGGGDQHGTIGNGQDPGTDLGKVLRIDPTPSTPVVQRWISGVRNPWRFSFDRANGDLWLADVGQSQWEEVDLLRAGQQQGRNLGWRCYEGTHVYSSCGAIAHTLPIFEYSHAQGGCAVTGGYVYRGSRIPALVGSYLFADYCDGELRALAESGGRVILERRLGVDPGSVVSFGQDAAGELYVLTPSSVFRVDPG